MWGPSHSLSCPSPGSGPARGQLRPAGSGPPTGSGHGAVVRAGKGKLLSDKDGSELKASQWPRGLCAAYRLLSNPSTSMHGGLLTLLSSHSCAELSGVQGCGGWGIGSGELEDAQLPGGAGAAAAAPPHELTPGSAPRVTSCGPAALQ